MERFKPWLIEAEIKLARWDADTLCLVLTGEPHAHAPPRTPCLASRQYARRLAVRLIYLCVLYSLVARAAIIRVGICGGTVQAGGVSSLCRG